MGEDQEAAQLPWHCFHPGQGRHRTRRTSGGRRALTHIVPTPGSLHHTMFSRANVGATSFAFMPDSCTGRQAADWDLETSRVRRRTQAPTTATILSAHQQFRRKELE